MHSGGSRAARQFLPTPIRDSCGRVVGQVRFHRGQLALICSVDERIHRLKSPPAWAKDRVALEQARRAGAEAVVLEDRVAGRRWVARLDDFDERGFGLDRGRGAQRALPLHLWRREDLAGPVQMDLFVGVVP